jgi:hypothetical protein
LTNKIVSTTKKISTIFFAIVLVTGTLALASSQSSFMVVTNVQAQPYYGGGMDNRYDDRKSYGMDSYGSSNYGNDNSYGYEQSQYQSSYGKDDKRDKSKDFKNIDINKLKCINTNININGNNSGNVSIGNKGAGEEGYLGAYSSDSGSGYSGSGEGYKKLDKGFDCIINNNNTNTNIGGGGNQTIPPEQKATLNVTKTVECEEENGNNDLVPVPRVNCERLQAIVTPSNFTIEVTDTDPQPDSFPGNAGGTLVQIGAGAYNVTETPDAGTAALLVAGSGITLETTFEGGCAPSGTGTIEAGVPETCNIINIFTIEKKCDDCFAELSVEVQNTINRLLAAPGPISLPAPIVYTIPESVTNIAQLCVHLESNPITITDAQISILVQAFVGLIGPGSQTIAQALVDCLIEANVIIVTDTAGLTASNINTDSNTNDLQITQGTADSPELTATEKMTKLKQQWLDLLP